MTNNAASTSNPCFLVNVGEAYPYPSHVSTPNFVTMKLGGKDTYNVWETQIQCLLTSHQMNGFIEGQFLCPAGGIGKGKSGEMSEWIISDSLVKGWIFGSLSDVVAKKVVNRLKHKQKNTDFTAKDLWDELQRSYGPPVRDQADSVIEEKTEGRKVVVKNILGSWGRMLIYDDILKGKKTDVVINTLKTLGINPWDKITNNFNTILHVAVGSSTKNHDLLEKLLEMTPTENTLLDLVNSGGSTLLHVAAIGGNIEVVEMLVKRNPELLFHLFVKDKEGHTPLAISVSNMHTKTSHCLFENMNVRDCNGLFSGQSGEELIVLAISCQDISLAKMIINEYPNAILSDSDVVLTTLAQNFPRELNFWERRGDFMEEVKDRTRSYEQIAESFDQTFGTWLAILFILFMAGTSWVWGDEGFEQIFST